MSTLLLIGYTNELGVPEIRGTGFVVSLGRKGFLVTCRHVVENQIPELLVAIPNPKEHVHPRDESDSFKLGKPIFHKNDTEHSSCDVAVYEIDIEARGKREILEPLAFESLSPDPCVREGTVVQVCGYSVPYLSRHFNPFSTRHLAPETRIGVVQNVPLENLRLGGFSRVPTDIQFLQGYDGIAIQEGTSGGIVARRSDGYCVGMLVASVNASLTLRDGTVVPVNGGAFIPALFVRQTIERS